MTEKVKPIIWEKGQNDFVYFNSLSTDQLLKFLSKNSEFAFYYITQVLYATESKVYRQGLGVRPETKVMFLIGDGSVHRNMRDVRDFAGKYIRTKETDGRQIEEEARKKLLGLFYKSPEADELRAEASFYLNGEHSVGSSIVFSEIADIFYNLFHLEIVDVSNQKQYKSWNQALQKILGLNTGQIIQLVAAKYHHRMFKNGGANGFNMEDNKIADLLRIFYKDLEEIDIKLRVSNFLRMTDILFDRILVDRLKSLRIISESAKNETRKSYEFDRKKVVASIRVVLAFLFGEWNDNHLLRMKEDEVTTVSSMLSALSGLLGEAEKYAKSGDGGL